MKIMYLIEGTGGGAVTHVLNLAKRLPRGNVQCFVVFFLNGPSVQVAKETDLETRTVRWRFPLDFTLMWRLKREIERERIEIVHTHTITGNFYARMAALLCRRPIKLVTTVHSWLRDELEGPSAVRLRDYLRFKRELLTSGWVSQFISVSEAIKERMLVFGIPEEKIEVIENGIELPELSLTDVHNRSVREEFDIRNDEILVATIGRMVPVKNQHLFLQAAQRVLEERSGVKFLLIGDGLLLDSLKRRARDLNIEKYAIFTGWRNDIHRFLCALDILVLCSTVEGLNMSVLEAMAHAKPVIGTDVRGIRDIVRDGQTGILVPPNNVDMLAQSMLKLIENRTGAREMGLKGRQRVEREYSVQRMVSRVVSIYEKLGPH